LRGRGYGEVAPLARFDNPRKTQRFSAGLRNMGLDIEEYFVSELGRIMGILAHILNAAEQSASAGRN
jgi:hypothetical protein